MVQSAPAAASPISWRCAHVLSWILLDATHTLGCINQAIRQTSVCTCSHRLPEATLDTHNGLPHTTPSKLAASSSSSEPPEAASELASDSDVSKISALGFLRQRLSNCFTAH